MLLMKEEENKKKIEKDLMELKMKKEKLDMRLKEGEESIYGFLSDLTKEGTISSSSFSFPTDKFYLLKVEKEIKEINEVIRSLNVEYKKIKEKIDRINEVDREREKTYERDFERKELKDAEEIKNIMKRNGEKGGLR